MAKVIMIQGTTSNAGKSVLAAGLCRIFRQDGYRVAPFKSQNMALNSWITDDGLEMGRAQVMQAEAAGIKPDVRMNPILLKPTSDAGSQVIVDGEVVGNMRAAAYFAYKKQLVPQVLQAYESLAAEYDIVVVEGAGSPAEINLKAEDIVNMGLARMIDAPVLLVGDIDRGGVFASLYGTVALLEEEERARIKGTVINKFRGDETILRPGLSMLEALTGKPVLGVIPYAPLDLDDEDSLSQRLDARGGHGALDIAVVRLPRISNFTDFSPLEQRPEVSLRYLSGPGAFGSPDLLILPGTKNTMEDLLWLRKSGLEAAILKYVSAGGVVLGVCGGYQMLGARLRDPQGLEAGGDLRGMGLLPVETVFAPAKTRTHAQGQVAALGGALASLSGLPLSGYEIHMGRSEPAAGALCEPFAHLSAFGAPKEADGAWHGNVYGTYLHGLFDRPELTDGLLSALLCRKGLSAQTAVFDPTAYRQRQYDQLAALLRAHLDLPHIYEIVKRGNEG